MVSLHPLRREGRGYQASNLPGNEQWIWISMRVGRTDTNRWILDCFAKDWAVTSSNPNPRTNSYGENCLINVVFNFSDSMSNNEPKILSLACDIGRSKKLLSKTPVPEEVCRISSFFTKVIQTEWMLAGTGWRVNHWVHCSEGEKLTAHGRSSNFSWM